MNLQQFAALKIGDKVTHPTTGSIGEVVELRDGGVVICWDGNPHQHFFSVRSTAWMHWDRAETVDQLKTEYAEGGDLGRDFKKNGI